MKTLVAGAVAVLVGFATLITSAAAPAAADASTINATCKYLEVRIAGMPGIDNQLYIGWEDTAKGLSMPMQSVGTTFADHDYYLTGLDPAGSYAWRVEVHAADGTVLWSQAGTTTACWPVDLGVTSPVMPPVPPCGSTLDDVAWPSTPGIVYSHDQWYGFARLLPGWQWPSNPPYKPLTWAYMDTIKSDLAVLQKEIILDPTGHCGIPRTAPPESALPGGKCWYQNPNPQPCSTPVYNGPSTPGSATTKVAEPAQTAAPARPTAAPSSGVTPTATSSPPASPTPTPSPAASRAGTPSPAPSPSATVATKAAARAATTTGLGVAGGLAGASVLAAAGAFVVRRRRHPSPNVVVLDEPTPGEPIGGGLE